MLAPLQVGWAEHLHPLLVRLGGAPGSLLGLAPTDLPLLLHLLDVLDANGAAAA